MGGAKSIMRGYLTHNCSDKELVDVSDYKEKAKSPVYDILFDDRHQLFSVDNSMDIKEYLNYLVTIKEIAQSNPTAGKYRYMLDLGFIPVSMPPVWLIDIVYNKVRPALESKNITFYQLPASSFINGAYTGGQPDIWVSKMEVCDICGCKPELVTAKRLLEVIGVC